MANRKLCALAVLLGLVSLVYGIMSDCELPKDKGSCDGRYRSYYFDMNSRECRRFIWSGCGGNGNKFFTLDECQFACHYYMRLKP
ncbi:kappaPI-actitoxin-Avd3d-like [Ostrinia furnacalis]|uniref:kappaPI-actitoxin-Avd3d-like n=1 Tax=Ostrinia furnacalis TaxID=93504 RepID=UPI001040DBDD|nr:kappaPI-actitoxin-Avd3d-like [Ostrinia furnacalis]